MNMKIGSIVRLIDPYGGDMEYRNAIGIVLKIYDSVLIPGKKMCHIRFQQYGDPLVHKIMEIYEYRLSIVKE